MDIEDRLYELQRKTTYPSQIGELDALRELLDIVIALNNRINKICEANNLTDVKL